MDESILSNATEHQLEIIRDIQKRSEKAYTHSFKFPVSPIRPDVLTPDTVNSWRPTHGTYEMMGQAIGFGIAEAIDKYRYTNSSVQPVAEGSELTYAHIKAAFDRLSGQVVDDAYMRKPISKRKGKDLKSGKANILDRYGNKITEVDIPNAEDS